MLLSYRGESVLAALTRAGFHHLRDAPEDAAPRGAFCCMGLCQECIVQVDGRQIESCRQLVTDGLSVTSLKRRSDV
ncbi:2Fe-2S iron-sulfur cluster-binding protein [Yoonia sp. GPGPB17]|uniref:2Fe-2S iron-sulfur cluster-binding protein n=1 Tax=Yoonia sp. GPGPB17 TaxID=3026147 RepID=UPI0040409415